MRHGCSASSARARTGKIVRRSTGGKAPRRQLSTATSSGAETESGSNSEADNHIEEHVEEHVEEHIEEEAVKQRQKEDKRQESYAQDMRVGIMDLLEKSRAIKEIDKDAVEVISIVAASYREALEEINKAISAQATSICSIFPHVRFESCSKEQLADLIWAYQYLEKLGSAGTEERKPTLYKVLYWIDRVAKKGEDETFAKRWKHSHLEKLWCQMD